MCLPQAVRDPDCVLATGEHAGYQWVVVKNWMGVRCGYVRIPRGHPWHGLDFEESEFGDVDVHGGLTFSKSDTPCDEPGEDDAWWIGFDCGHGGDAPDVKLMDDTYRRLHEEHFQPVFSFDTVRSQEYAESECRSLCEQAKAISRKA